jgi:hypothetical protein
LTGRTAGARQDGDGLALAFLVGLRPADCDPHALVAERQVLDVQRHDLRLPKRTGKAQHDQGSISSAFSESSGIAPAMRLAIVAVTGSLLACAVPSERRRPFMVDLSLHVLLGVEGLGVHKSRI